MEVKLVKIERAHSKAPCQSPEHYSEDWPEDVNAKFVFRSLSGQATLLHECGHLTTNGWPAGGNNTGKFRCGWNFSSSGKLVAREPAAIAFTHLFAKSKKPVTFWLCIKFSPSEPRKSMVELANEILYQVEPQL